MYVEKCPGFSCTSERRLGTNIQNLSTCQLLKIHLQTYWECVSQTTAATALEVGCIQEKRPCDEVARIIYFPLYNHHIVSFTVRNPLQKGHFTKHEQTPCHLACFVGFEGDFCTISHGMVCVIPKWQNLAHFNWSTAHSQRSSIWNAAYYILNELEWEVAFNECPSYRKCLIIFLYRLVNSCLQCN